MVARVQTVAFHGVAQGKGIHLGLPFSAGGLALKTIRFGRERVVFGVLFIPLGQPGVDIGRLSRFVIRDMLAACEAAMPGLRLCAFGHIGDGNLHFNLSQPVGMDKAAFLAEWHRFNTIVHDAVAARGGSIAAEHGVGLNKRDELLAYKDPVALALMARVKAALDPLDILNPGKVVRMRDDLPMFKPGG